MNYSQTPEEFQQKFHRSLDSQREFLWKSEFANLKSQEHFQFDEIEDVLMDSDFQRDIFEKHREQYQNFESMIPSLEKNYSKKEEGAVFKDMMTLVDYLYCLHGYYSWSDRLVAKLRAFFIRFSR